MTVGRSQLVRLTGGKAIANTALRWNAFFLPTLAIAFSASTDELTTILGIGEMAALVTLVVGRYLRGGNEKRFMTLGLVMVAISSFGALTGSLVAFAASFVALVTGVAIYTVGGHTYLSERVSFDRRGRAIGLFETSWASALLIGAPLIALLINAVGWRGPFVVLGVLAAVMAAVVWRTEDAVPLPAVTFKDSPSERLNGAAWRVVFASAAIGTAGLSTIVIAGTWLNDELGVSTGGLGLVAMTFGAAELSSSITSAVFSDRLGKTRSTRAALVIVVLGLAIMTQAGSSLLFAVIGLLCFFVGFEYAIVTSFSIVSEAMPEARGRALTAGTAVGTVGRGGGTVASGLLYEAYGIQGPAVLSIAAASVAIVLLSVHAASAAGRAMADKETRDFRPS